jgi:hypothetical protein
VAHGLLVWFDTGLLGEIGFSNAPDSQARAEVYGSGFFPFLHPVEVMPEDRAEIALRAVLVNDEYTWRWDTRILSGENTLKADYQQSTFYGTIFSPEKLRKRRPGHVPTLREKGLIEHFIQGHMDGQHTLEAIGRKLLERFPGQFSSLQEAIERAGDSCEKYGS